MANEFYANRAIRESREAAGAQVVLIKQSVFQESLAELTTAVNSNFTNDPYSRSAQHSYLSGYYVADQVFTALLEKASDSAEKASVSKLALTFLERFSVNSSQIGGMGAIVAEKNFKERWNGMLELYAAGVPLPLTPRSSDI